MRLPSLCAFVFVAFLAVAVQPAATTAVPTFSHQYAVSCAKCHSVVPHLNEFGAAFVANGYRIPGVSPGSALPFSVKANLVGSSQQQGDGSNGAGLPKAIVDEIELFVTGGIGTRASYFIEQYAVDGGMPGLTRDAWVMDRVNPWQARIPVFAQAGSFTLPLPVDPETFRDSYQGYSLYTQTVGANPFQFFDPKVGLRVSVGDALRGLNGQLFAGPGHDRQSGLATTGLDTMGVIQDAVGPLTVSAYRYAGTRPTAAGPDAFWRTGYGLVYNQWGRLSSETVLQTGWDANCGASATRGYASSGGFSQLRFAVNRRLYVLGRYEGTDDPTNGFTRHVVALIGYAPTRHSRVTFEDVMEHVPQTMHTLNVQFTVAY